MICLLNFTVIPVGALDAVRKDILPGENRIVTVQIKNNVQWFDGQGTLNKFDISKIGSDIISTRIKNLKGSDSAFTAACVSLRAGSRGFIGKTFRKSGNSYITSPQRFAIIDLTAGRCLECYLSTVFCDFQSTDFFGQGVVSALCTAPVNTIGVVCGADSGD